MLLIFLTVGGIAFSGMLKNASRQRRALTYGLAVFGVLLVFRLLWP